MLEHVLKTPLQAAAALALTLSLFRFQLYFTVILKKSQITEDVNSLVPRETMKTVEVLGGHYFQQLILSLSQTILLS